MMKLTIKSKNRGCMFVIGILLFVLFAFALSTLIFWGLGNLVIYVLEIDYTWTILHGLCCALIISVLKSIFSNGGKS